MTRGGRPLYSVRAGGAKSDGGSMRSSRFGVAGQHLSGGGDDRFDAATLDAVEYAASVLCKRWKAALLYLLGSGHQRYNALARRLPSTTPKMLTQQLRELERDGLLLRIARSDGPRHVEYTLTPMGEALRPVVEALAAWGREYQEHEPRQESLPGASETRRPAHEREVRREVARPADGGRPAAPPRAGDHSSSNHGAGRAAS